MAIEETSKSEQPNACPNQLANKCSATYKTVYLMNESILHVYMYINGEPRDVLVDTAASVRIINVKRGQAFFSGTVQLRCGDGTSRPLRMGSTVGVEF